MEPRTEQGFEDQVLGWSPAQVQGTNGTLGGAGYPWEGERATLAAAGSGVCVVQIFRFACLPGWFGGKQWWGRVGNAHLS